MEQQLNQRAPTGAFHNVAEIARDEAIRECIALVAQCKHPHCQGAADRLRGLLPDDREPSPTASAVALLEECRAYLDPARGSLTGSELRDRLDRLLSGNAPKAPQESTPGGTP